MCFLALDVIQHIIEKKTTHVYKTYNIPKHEHSKTNI
jgi:hypothetical protein